VKVAEVEPEGTVTVDGTEAHALVDERLTTTPPDPAAAPIVTVPVEVDPATTPAGQSESPDTVGAEMVRDAVKLAPP
jgi:hypothetical protein